MKHYPHHIGDFDKATRHLTRLERSVYRDLIDLYYDTEEQIPLDLAVVCRKIIAPSSDEATAVEQVLNEFFTETQTGWFHARCDQEICKYRANNSQKAQAGKASAAAKAAKRQQALDARSTGVKQTSNDTPTNHKPRTINQIGETPCKRSAPTPVLECPEDVDPQTWADWQQLRKTKKAPVTATVLKGAREQAAIAGMTLTAFLAVWCRRGSQGLEASWLKPDERVSVAPTETSEQYRARKDAEYAQQKSQTGPPPPEIAAQINAALKGKVHKGVPA
jgi:uncharacterized protein YdaU (DUF1376 family)